MLSADHPWLATNALGVLPAPPSLICTDPAAPLFAAAAHDTAATEALPGGLSLPLPGSSMALGAAGLSHDHRLESIAGVPVVAAGSAVKQRV